jgi:hypothetical protein
MENLLATIKNKNYLGLKNKLIMDRHQILYDQLMKAIAAFEEATEMEELAKQNYEVSRQLKSKADNALKKEQLGQIVTEEEQSDINDLAKRQEEICKKMADKILKK